MIYLIQKWYIDTLVFYHSLYHCPRGIKFLSHLIIKNLISSRALSSPSLLTSDLHLPPPPPPETLCHLLPINFQFSLPYSGHHHHRRSTLVQIWRKSSQPWPLYPPTIVKQKIWKDSTAEMLLLCWKDEQRRRMMKITMVLREGRGCDRWTNRGVVVREGRWCSRWWWWRLDGAVGGRNETEKE